LGFDCIGDYKILFVPHVVFIFFVTSFNGQVLNADQCMLILAVLQTIYLDCAVLGDGSDYLLLLMVLRNALADGHGHKDKDAERHCSS